METKPLFDKLKDIINQYMMEKTDTPEPADENTSVQPFRQAAEPEKISFAQILAALFNGLGAGLLLGLLLGLAVSPVVSAFIGTFSSLLVLLIGLNEKYFNIVKSVRIGAFGLFAVAGILAGFYIRSNSPLAPSLSELKSEYRSLGFSETQAKDFIAYQEFGLIPPNWQQRKIAPKEDAKKSDDSTDVSSSVQSEPLLSQNMANVAKRNNFLFSSTVNIGDCRILETSHNKMDFKKIKRNFSAAGGTWQELVENIDPNLPDQVKVDAVLGIRDVFCGSGNSGTVKINCTTFEPPADEIPLKELKTELSKSDDLWKKIIQQIDASVEEQYQQKLYLSLVNILCHD